jgi:hypothetical protein
MMVSLLAPIALVSYIVAAIAGSCGAILIAAAWRALDKIVTRFVMWRRARKPKAITVIRVAGKIVGRNR